jgi:RNA polymerase sigma-70 factor, ECF subfamily
VNGAPGIVVGRRGRLELVLSFTVANEKITAIDVIADPSHRRQLDLAVLDTDTEGPGAHSGEWK